MTTACAPPASWAASMPPSTWRCGTRDFAASAPSADLDALLAALARTLADVLALTQQPLRWHDLHNPFALLPHQASVNDCPLMTMVPGAPPTSRISNSFRRRLKSKERKLQALAGYRYHVATTDADITRLLDWFFRVKPLRMAEQKLPNVFAEPGVEDFIRSACMAPLRRRPRHRHPCAGMRRRGDRDLRRRRRRPALLDDVQHLHDVRQARLQPRPDPDARHHRSLCRTRLSLARSRHRLGRLQAAVLQGRRADLRQLRSAQPRAASSRRRRCPR